MPTVVQVAGDAGVFVGPVGVVADADVLDHRVDLDRVHPGRAEPQRVRQVVAGARADDQHVPERLAAARPLQEMDQRVGGAALPERDHRLVADGVDADVAARGVVKDLVVGRPARLDRPWDRRRASPRAPAGPGGPKRAPAQPSALPQQVTHAGAADEEPDHGRCLGKGQGREPGDAREAAADVERVAAGCGPGRRRTPARAPAPAPRRAGPRAGRTRPRPARSGRRTGPRPGRGTPCRRRPPAVRPGGPRRPRTRSSDGRPGACPAPPRRSPGRATGTAPASPPAAAPPSSRRTCPGTRQSGPRW